MRVEVGNSRIWVHFVETSLHYIRLGSSELLLEHLEISRRLANPDPTFASDVIRALKDVHAHRK